MPGLKLLLVTTLTLLAAASLACDESNNTKHLSETDTARCAAISVDDSPLGGVAEMFCRASFKATYDWGVRPGEEAGVFPVPKQVTLYKLGLDRLRVDAVIEAEDPRAAVTVIAESVSGEEQQQDFIFCSFGDAIPEADFGGDVCFRTEDANEIAGVFLYSTLSWLYGGSSVHADELVPSGTRSVAGRTGNCFANTDANEIEAEFCYDESGIALYAHVGEHVIEATNVSADVDSDDFEPPLAISAPPTPADEGPQPTVPPDEQVEVRLAPGDGVSVDALQASLDVLRRRVVATDPRCQRESAPANPDDPSDSFVRECVFLEDGHAVLRFTISGYDDSWTDDELDQWLTATGDGTEIHLRFCEPMLDAAGNVAVVADGLGTVAYEPGTCQPDLSGDRVRVRDSAGLLPYVDVTYVDRLDAIADAIVWTPAIGEVDGQQIAMTDEHLIGAYFDHPVNFTHRFFYRPSPDGERILDSIWSRLGPQADRRQRTSYDQYSLSLFIDGVPLRDLRGDLALVRIWSTDWGLSGIVDLSRSEAQRVTRLIVGPELPLQLEVVSITRSLTARD